MFLCYCCYYYCFIIVLLLLLLRYVKYYIFFKNKEKNCTNIYIYILLYMVFFLSAGVGYASSTIGWCAPMGHVGP